MLSRTAAVASERRMLTHEVPGRRDCGLHRTLKRGTPDRDLDWSRCEDDLECQAMGNYAIDRRGHGRMISDSAIGELVEQPQTVRKATRAERSWGRGHSKENGEKT